jgi:hypothetical protein
MELTLNIACVDGDTFFQMTSSSPTELSKFLKNQDHEGSTLSLQISTHVSKNVYDILYALKKCFEE